MDVKFIVKLFECNRTGLIIKLIKDNIHKWSIKDFQYIFDNTFCGTYDTAEQCKYMYSKVHFDSLFNIFYYMTKYFYKSDTLYVFDERSINSHSFKFKCNNIIKYILIKNPYVRSGCYFTLSCCNGNVEAIKNIMTNKYIEESRCIIKSMYYKVGLRDLYQNHILDIMIYVLNNINLHPSFISRKYIGDNIHQYCMYHLLNSL